MGERAPDWVQFLALSLFILLALSLRASFTLSPDTCSYDNFCNSISVEEIGFTVHLILFLFFPENSAAWPFSLTLCGYFWFCISKALRLNVFPFGLLATGRILFVLFNPN